MRSPATDLGPLRYATSDLPERDRPPFWRELFARKVVLYDVDALIAVFDAKYRYNFWRPITAIRNGDIDGNPATDREPTWQPIDNTPMQPEYPCAHCISSGAVAWASLQEARKEENRGKNRVCLERKNPRSE